MGEKNKGQRKIMRKGNKEEELKDTHQGKLKLKREKGRSKNKGLIKNQEQ